MQSAAYIRLKIKAEGSKLIHIATAGLNSLSETIKAEGSKLIHIV